MNKMQLVQFDLLKRLIELLENNGIEYWLAYGTVLGAVRHNGFIPWDDDVDIYINGNQYHKLRKIFGCGKINNMRMDDFGMCNVYPFTFPKIIDTRTKLKEKRYEGSTYMGGVYIDVFPLYEVNNIFLFRKIGYLYRYFNYVIVESHWLNKIEDSSSLCVKLAFFLRLFSEDSAKKKLQSRYEKGFSNKSVLISEPLSFNDKNLHVAKHFYGKVLHQFESIMAYVPCDFDGYLKSQYGDYMKLPPEGKRQPCHNFTFVEYPDGEGMKGEENE